MVLYPIAVESVAQRLLFRVDRKGGPPDAVHLAPGPDETGRGERTPEDYNLHIYLPNGHTLAERGLGIYLTS